MIPTNWKDLILSGNYKASYSYLVYFGILAISGFFSLNAMTGLGALKEFSIITKTQTVTMIIVLISAYYLIQNFGIEGGLFSLIFGQVILALSLWVLFSNYKKKYQYKL
jgi:O-antigen/teichoic acid export membrane protein